MVPSFALELILQARENREGGDHGEKDENRADERQRWVSSSSVRVAFWTRAAHFTANNREF